jgi:hypothetical protein
MATNTKQYFPTHPGADGFFSPADLHFSTAKNGAACAPEARVAANILGEKFSKNMFPRVGGAHPYTAAHWTVTTTGTGAAVADATTAGGGLLLTTGSTSTFNTNLQSKQVWTPVADKWFTVLARLRVSSITAVGFELNIGNSQVDPASTPYTDVVGLKMAVGAGTVVGNVAGNSGTAANSSTLYTMAADTDAFLGFTFKLNATATSAQGFWFAGSSLKTATVTPFTAAQLTQLAAILTTPPSMYLNLHAKGSAANPTITYTSVLAHVDN